MNAWAKTKNAAAHSTGSIHRGATEPLGPIGDVRDGVSGDINAGAQAERPQTCRSGLSGRRGRGRGVVDHGAVAGVVGGETVGVGFEVDQLRAEVL